MAYIIATEKQNDGLILTSRQTEAMLITKKHCNLKCDIMVNGTSFKPVNV